MPLLNETSIEIDGPIEKVFDLTLQNVPEWSNVVAREEIIEDRNQGGVGTRLRIYTRDRGHEMVFDGEVIHHERPYTSAIRMTGQHFDIEAAYHFEDLQGRTRMTQFSKVEGKGITKLVFSIFGWMMKRANCDAQRQELESLKRYVEARC